MFSGERFSRSRTGCLQCRHKHRKCDEKQPTCTFCITNQQKCEYPSALRWVQREQPKLSRHKSRRQRSPEEGWSDVRGQAPLILVNAVFQSADEQSAWEYYIRLVSSNVPALDGPDNPYRQLSVTALSSPVLRETILCISTEHMLNFGLGSVSVAAERQRQMLRSIAQGLRTLDNRTSISLEESVMSVENYEALLAAIILQGVVVAQTEDGAVEPHVKCAVFLIRALGLFRQEPRTPLVRMCVQRFAMVDVMLAISRQRRPFAPIDFILYQPDESRWDRTEPSFLKMTGCPQPLMCLLVQLSHLACDVDDRLESGKPISDLLMEAFKLETEIRALGSQYNDTTADRSKWSYLEILAECFYWTAHILLARRIFRDETRSIRVQHLAWTCFRLMDLLPTGCGPDSSLPQPFYLAAREAVTEEDRSWVRRKHEAMVGYYRELQRNAAMRLTETIWAEDDRLNRHQSKDTQKLHDRFIRQLDRHSCLFIF
ncbi:hypothetical protein N8T08_005622 [Aspergillus melleus]|uniref:Uncharacterized protein n=1 Tax=Aspergillus melleus TaxID=138277 RepID=A0ACC3B1I2_9EURO|nr:hypothetical protein N8T08_005622 [Aspergillus melleus]